MRDMSDHRLLEDLKTASRGSHELSHRVYMALVWRPGLTSDSEYTPPYTTSVDAALTLVPEDKAGFLHAAMYQTRVGDIPDDRLALVICIAVLEDERVGLA